MRPLDLSAGDLAPFLSRRSYCGMSLAAQRRPERGGRPGGCGWLVSDRRGPWMSITVRELLQLPHLQVSLIVGEAGIDREVSWVHTSDLPNPWEWHGSGELLLTNGT